MNNRPNQQPKENSQQKSPGQNPPGTANLQQNSLGNKKPGQKNGTNAFGSSDSGQKKAQEKNSWLNHPDLAGMDAAKLAMLNTLAQQGAGKNPSELLPFLMSAATQNKSRGLRFSSQEMDAIIQVLKAGKSPEEVARMEKIIQMMKLFH